MKKSRADLMAPRGNPGIHLLTLSVCILINILYFLFRPDYFGLFIAASFYLNMYYFITLIIPTNFERPGVPSSDLTKFQSWLRDIGVTSGVTQFTRLFINTLFMNSRALSLGLGLIFSIDIVFTCIHYFRSELPLRTAALVILQCMIIVSFYLLVWKIEPFSTTYVKKVEGVKSILHRKNLPESLVAAMFVFGFFIAIFLFLITIIYLPGVTVNAFLDRSHLTELGHLFSLLAVLAISQYFIIRYIHGITSRTMAERLFDFKENSLTELLGQATAAVPDTAAFGETPLEMTQSLLESKIFIVKRNSLSGAFPVFVVDLDFSVLMDTTTLTAIKGYIVEKKR